MDASGESTLVALVDGPLWTIAWISFVIGVTWRLASILGLGVSPDRSRARGGAIGGAAGTLARRFLPRRELARATRFQLVAGYMFHLGLFAVVVLAAPHVAFIDERILGFGWTPMPHWAFVLSAEIAFAGLILLWLRRLLHPVSRMISTFDDHMANALVFAAMGTGCLALGESSEALRVLHLFSVELLLVSFPFSRLMHAFTFATSRGFTGAAAGRHGVRA